MKYMSKELEASRFNTIEGFQKKPKKAMSKELEALEILKDFKAITGQAIGQDIIEPIEKALTPPTAEEVCQILTDYLNSLDIEMLSEVRHTTKPNEFYYYNDDDYEEYIIEYDEATNVLSFIRDFPPHIVEVIAKFYKGVKR